MTGYTNHPETGALMSIDRTVRANYDHEYVAKYEALPQESMSALRVYTVATRLPDVLHNESRILDVGCGTGAFLREAHKANPGLRLHGYDVSPYPLPEFVKVVPDWIDHEWDLVTFYDSLEHFVDLSWLKRLRTRSAVVSVPWYHPQMGSDWFARWKHHKPGEHLWYFTPETLIRTMAQANLWPCYVAAPEDLIRKGEGNLPNILTICFRS